MIKKLLKKLLPSPVLKVIRRTKYLISSRIHRYYFPHCISKISKRSDKNRPVEAAIFFVRAEHWNSCETIYRYAKSRKDLNITVYVLPHYIFNDDGKRKLDLKGYTEMISFLEKRGINFVLVYDIQNDKWIDIKHINLDYVLYIFPYNSIYPEEFSMSRMYKRAKLCYVPYGFILTNDTGVFRIVLAENFMRFLYIFFASWSGAADYAEELYSKVIGHKVHNVVRLGYPRFDLRPKSEYLHEKVTILWNPRFAVKGVNYPDVPTAETSFFAFKDEIINRAYKEENEYWIIRPHPDLFPAFLRHKLITPEESEKYISELERHPNAELDKEKDYLVAFDRSDVMLADFSSIVIEYAALGKPIIYCGNPEAIPIPEMLECMYLANSWDKAVYYLDELKKGNDPLAEKRRIFMSMIASDGRSGERIVEYILDDYRKSAGGNNHNA